MSVGYPAQGLSEVFPSLLSRGGFLQNPYPLSVSTHVPGYAILYKYGNGNAAIQEPKTIQTGRAQGIGWSAHGGDYEDWYLLGCYAV